MQRRQYLRVRLRLLARLRWSAPLGQQTDQCETINVSRGGLLLSCHQAHGTGYPLWVTIPFDPQAAGAQPETLARVVRCVEADGGKHSLWNVAMHFEGADDTRPRRNGKAERKKNQNGAGSKVALPIHVRPVHIPWHEEAMTVEISRDKLKFVTNREYAFGERLLVSFGSGSAWSGEGEWETQVTGIEMEAGSDSVCVTVRKKSDRGGRKDGPRVV